MIRGDLQREAEREAIPVLDWIDDHGREHGFRIPTPRERARSTGRMDYFDELRLSDVQLFDAVGNHFDADALRCCVTGPLADQLSRLPRGTHRVRPPADLAVVYRRLAVGVRAQGMQVAPGPFPLDLAWLAALHDWPGTVGGEPGHRGDMGLVRQEDAGLQMGPTCGNLRQGAHDPGPDGGGEAMECDLHYTDAASEGHCGS